MEKRITAIIVLIIFSFSGCSVSSPSDQMEHKEIENQEQTTEGNGKNEAKSEEPKETSTTDIAGTEETKEYVLPETIWKITGITAEEQAGSFRAENPGNYFFTDIKVNEENALVLTMTEHQKNIYEKEVSSYLYADLEEAEQKEDIFIEINEDYSEMHMIMGENSSSIGFQVTFIKLASDIAVYQILNGCEPEEWGFRLIVEREEEIVLDVNVPDDSWEISSERLEGQH